eukprot:gene18485-biopygen14491
MDCACGAEHAALVVRWQGDTLFVQLVPRGLPWSPATGDGGAGAEVVWTDLVVGASDAGVYVLPREARFADAADFKRVAPRVSLRWLWKGAFSVPMNDFVRLKDVGCLAWRVWDVRAVLLLLAGYSWREVSNAAAQALRRRMDAAAARFLVQRWVRDRLLLDWADRIASSCAGPQDGAMVQRAIAHRDARVALSERGD